MIDDEDPPGERKLRAILKSAKPAASKPRKRPTPKPPNIAMNGSGNFIVGDGNTIQSGPAPRPRVVVEAKPGVEHITDAQAAELKAIIDKIVEESASVKRKPTTHAAQFRALNTAMRVTTYKLILAGQFDAAKAFLQRRRAITRAMPSAKKKVDGWRASTIGAIHARCRETADGTERRKAYMLKKLGTDTMKECSDEQIEQIRKHVFGWRPKG